MSTLAPHERLTHEPSCVSVFACRQSFVNFDPHLVVGTVFFLASKVEESQLSLATVASVLHHYTTSKW